MAIPIIHLRRACMMVLMLAFAVSGCADREHREESEQESDLISKAEALQKTLQVPPAETDIATTILEEEQVDQTTVHISSLNEISVDDEPITEQARLADILRSKGTTDVLITSHEDAKHEMLVKVVDAAQEVGMQKIRIGVTKGSEAELPN